MPHDLAIAHATMRLRQRRSSPIVELGRLARLDYYFIGTVESQQQHHTGLNRLYMDRDIGKWVYTTEEKEAGLIVTNVGCIAILAGLFGDLNVQDQRWMLGVPLTATPPPHFGWRQLPGYFDPTRVEYEACARPELIAKAQLEGPELTGYIDLVKAPDGYSFESIGNGLYKSSLALSTRGTLQIDGTALNTFALEPDCFDDIPPNLST